MKGQLVVAPNSIWGFEHLIFDCPEWAIRKNELIVPLALLKLF